MNEAAILNQLPAVFQQTAPPGIETPLRTLAGLMEQLHRDDEQILGDFGRFIDAYRTPDQFVTYLASWLGLGWLFLEDTTGSPAGASSSSYPAGLGALRELTQAAASNVKWSGTAQGLRRTLETATGITGFRVDEVAPAAGAQATFAISVQVPTRAARYLDLVQRIVEHEKPAHVTSSVALEPAPDS
jgi:phage tail-like protein